MDVDQSLVQGKGGEMCCGVAALGILAWTACGLLQAGDGMLTAEIHLLVGIWKRVCSECWRVGALLCRM